MRLAFLGGADEIGASSTLVEMGGKRILVDCGIRISPRSNRGIRNDQLPDLHPVSEMGGPDYILVTHAHTDHTGAIPLILEQYPHVPVLATRPTQVLVRILQRDAQRIMKSKQEEEGELPIFDEIASQRLMDSFQTVEFAQSVRLGDGLQVTFHPAGHIAGASMLVLEGEDGVLVMSGDLSVPEQRAVVGTSVPRIKADALILESTYGGKLHANRVAEEKRLISTLKRIIERGGTALIPAFALGRAQEVLQIILAYRDQIDAPVYVDGMVRAVCRGYAGFADLLPKNTVRMAKDDHLFFRNKIKPIESAAMRDQIANSGEPAIIVASSGMLTGGASVAYARALAGDARNAILMTGYQDEEAPGRRLQNLMKEQERGEALTMKLDGKLISVRCEIGTYSLSAHADESELVGIAEAVDADEVMVVHGDPSARHSLATSIRQRGRRVISPRIGQTISFAFAKRPWAMGQVKSGNETRPLDARALWEALEGNAGNYYGARELAQMWWGDIERDMEVVYALKDNIYFAADWRRKDTFQVHSEAQVIRRQRCQAIMLANPDIVGKLVVLRDSNNRPKAGVVVDAGIDAFEAEVSNAKGRHYPGDALLWVIGDWKGYSEGKGKKGQTAALVRNAKVLQDRLLPFVRRQALVAEGKPIVPETLLPEMLPEGVTQQEALMAIVLGLAVDGAVLEQGGLLPKRALVDGPMEQNQAREMALAAFPAAARLRKAGMDIHRKRLTLTFDFPEYAAREFAEVIDNLEEQSGWDVHINPTVNQQALGFAVDEFLPQGARVVKGPSFFMDKREVVVEVEGVDDLKALERSYLELTGHRLITSKAGDGVSGTVTVQPSGNDKLEINEAYGLIRAALNDCGLYKVGLKQGQIILTFISPQVGERHQEIIERLAEETGYGLSVHPHPNQQQILQVASSLLREAEWVVHKGPGIHVERNEVTVTLAEQPDEVILEEVNDVFEEDTGFRLIVSYS
jgi:uncharacterized protein